MTTPVGYKTDSRRALVAAGLIAALLVLAGGIVLVVSLQYGGADGGSRPRAAIVDQLAITDPDPDFIASATRRLEAAGYRVDYYPADAVTVNLYRGLPAGGYRFVILRSHSSGNVPQTDEATGALTFVASVGLFTNEAYSEQKHVGDQREQLVTRDFYVDREIPWPYFGITPAFVRATSGDFAGATIVLMGCDGLSADDMAKAFIEKGAVNFVSWDAQVTAEHTDAATDVLLEHMLDDGLPTRDAIAKTMAEVGPDPAFGSRLLAYP